MPVVILCGGMGTRLREETEYKPKPMVEIGGRPVIWHIMKIYSSFGYKRFILCLGYKGSHFKDYFLNYEAISNDFAIKLGNKSEIFYLNNHEEQDFEVNLVDTGLYTMTGGRIKRIEHLIDTDTFMLTYGDGLADVNIDQLVSFHFSHGKMATLTATKSPSRYGVIDLQQTNEVTEFREKVQIDWINGGFLVLNKKVFKYLNDNSIFEKEPMENLAKDGQLMGFRHEGFWIGMDTYREYEMLNKMWDSGEIPWKVWK
ncbi:glucose-1-phosphate cytidylyltransferase [Smithella sp. F21]|nr:glucose-1-phosphate cytidylyltransferase [Smithella sp. F21]